MALGGLASSQALLENPISRLPLSCIACTKKLFRMEYCRECDAFEGLACLCVGIYHSGRVEAHDFSF